MRTAGLHIPADGERIPLAARSCVLRMSPRSFSIWSDSKLMGNFSSQTMSCMAPHLSVPRSTSRGLARLKGIVGNVQDAMWIVGIMAPNGGSKSENTTKVAGEVDWGDNVTGRTERWVPGDIFLIDKLDAWGEACSVMPEARLINPRLQSDRALNIRSLFGLAQARGLASETW